VADTSGKLVCAAPHPSDTSTYDKTYSAKGPFSGLESFAAGPVDVEPDPVAELDCCRGGRSRWAPRCRPTNRDSSAYGAEFEVWPAAAAGAWLLLAEHKPTPALFPSFS
jgi:hypothetical protein